MVKKGELQRSLGMTGALLRLAMGNMIKSHVRLKFVLATEGLFTVARRTLEFFRGNMRRLDVSPETSLSRKCPSVCAAFPVAFVSTEMVDTGSCKTMLQGGKRNYDNMNAKTYSIPDA